MASRFVGRTAELARLHDAFAAGARLVTIAGGHGIGKTRLAEHYAAAAPEAWVCRLDGVDDAWLAVAREVGLDDADGLADWLARRGPAVLVLDDLPRAAGMVMAPELRVIATSHEPLGVAGEVVIELEALTHGDAVQLFVERAAPFLDAPDPQRVEAIVDRLEGVPLAIELAAALVASLGLDDLAARIAGGVAWLDRAGVLRGAIAGSWELLGPADQRALAECTVFAGGFFADAAEAVLSGDDVLAGLGRLHARSLLRTVVAPGFEGRRRFAMFRAIREVAAGHRAELGIGDELEQRHAAYYVRFGRNVADTLTRTGDAEAHRLLALEKQNMLAIAAAAEDELRLGAIVALDPVLRAEGPHDEHRRLVDDGVALARRIGSPCYGELVLARGEIARRRGDLDAAVADLHEAQAIAETTSETGLLGRALAIEAMIHHQAGRLDDAERLSRDAIANSRLDGDGRSERIARITLALVLVDQDRGELAQAELEETLVLAQEVRDRFIEAMALRSLSHARRGGPIDEHRAQLQRARALGVELGDRRTEGLVVSSLATAEHAAGNLAEARALYRDAIALLAGTGYRFEGLYRGQLSALLADLDVLDEAVAERARAAGISRRVGDPALERSLALHAGHLELLHARRARQRGDHDAAAARIAAAEHALATTDTRDSDEVRFASERLAHGLAALRADALVVAAGGLRFHVAGRWVSLVRRRALARLLVALAEAHRDAPGHPVTVARLVDRGWPGEKLAGQSGVHRLRVAVATLRKLGLKDLLLTSGDGYLLDPAASARLL